MIIDRDLWVFFGILVMAGFSFAAIGGFVGAYLERRRISRGIYERSLVEERNFSRHP